MDMGYFNYNTFNADLEKETKTLRIQIHKEFSQEIRMEFLFELESILAWCTSKVEIASILIYSKSDFISLGFTKKQLTSMSQTKLEKISKNVQLISYSLIHLPQTVIVDFGKGAFNIGFELFLGADLKIAHKGCKLAINHSKLGLIPCSGGMGILNAQVGQAFARNWLLSSQIIDKQQLTASGFIFRFYENNQQLHLELLNTIAEQAPFQRIQSKLGLYEGIKHDIESAMLYEKQVAKAARISQDWKDEQAMPAKSVKESVKLSLIKNPDLEP